MKRILTLMLACVPGMVAALSGSISAAQDAQCGTDVPCEIDGGSYHLSVPQDWDGTSALPAIVFFHGHRSSGKSALRGSVRSVFGKAGYVIIAPNGPIRAGADYRYWPARPTEPPQRDDIAFTERVVADAVSRLPIDRDRILVGGFSAGGSMAWMIACYRGGIFAGYVPVAGALRRPAPEGGCPGGPVNMLHIHGFADKQVPLEGRAIRDWHQGDVSESFSLLRDANGCRSNPHAFDNDTQFWCRTWNQCSSGAEARFCLHDGGHGLPKGWASEARRWFENLPQGG